MALPDIEGLSLAELRSLANAISAQASVLEAQAVEEEKSQRDAVTGAIASLEALLGPENAAPGTDSIRAVLAFGDDAIRANASQAVPLIVHGMEQLTATVLGLARVVQANRRD